MRSLVHLEWTRVGYPSLPQNAEVDAVDDAVLSLREVSDEDAGQYRCTATTVNSIATDDATLTISTAASQYPLTNTFNSGTNGLLLTTQY